MAAPYYLFRDIHAQITIASPSGGPIPIDALSETPQSITETATRFKADVKAVELLAASVPLDNVTYADFDLIFIVGGHGSMFDLKNSKQLRLMLEYFINANKPIATIGSGATALLSLTKNDGTPYVKDKKLTAYSNEEVELEGLINSVPFLLESELLSLGAFYSRSARYTSHVVADKNLVTGQNPASSYDTAQKVITLLMHQREMALSHV